MPTIAHIINPVGVDETYALRAAQPLTFETMRAARRFAGPTVEVDFLTAQFPEDRPLVPDGFRPTPDLDRSVLDIRPFRTPRKLPILKDILDRLFAGTSADYLVYTNVDIGLLPFFYRTVLRIIEDGRDAFVLNRRTIPDAHRRLADVPLMYAAIGDPHPGWDCFIFHHSLYPGFDLGTACIGAPWIGRIMITNLAVLGRSFAVFEDLHVTFHLGDDRGWKEERFADYLDHNRAEGTRILSKFDRERGPLDRETYPGLFFKYLEHGV